MFFGIVWHKFAQMYRVMRELSRKHRWRLLQYVFKPHCFYLWFFSVRCIFQTFAAVMKNECFAIRTYIIKSCQENKRE